MPQLVGVLITLSFSEPSEERLSRLADFLASWEVDVFLAGASAPFGNDFFAEDVVVI